MYLPIQEMRSMIYLRTRAVLFIRVNRRYVNNYLLAERAIERQRALGEQVARKLQATIVRVYVDQSGAALPGNRPELQIMLRSLKSHPVSYVVVEDWTVFSSSPKLSTVILMSITDAGAELVVGDGLLSQPGDDDEYEHVA
jgi:DNA invertase Pin-like site-specific DNA recombinase